MTLDLVAAICQAGRGFGCASAVAVWTALALPSLFFSRRAFPLAVQARVIRFEERLRRERLLPALFREVVAGRLQKPGEIQRAIRTWRPDHRRA